MKIDSGLPDDWKEPSLNGTKFDEAAFALLFKTNFKPLCTYCQLKFGFELDTVKEVVHDSMVKLWEKRESLSTNLYIKGYLYKIVDNISFDIIRHERIKEKHLKNILQHSSQKDLVVENNDNYDFKQLSQNVDKAISEMPTQMRRIFEMSRDEGLKYTEISSQLKISIKTVEIQMSRALAKLRHKLSRFLNPTNL
jgi:RNA polymerase sigma-70 factor (ECF subfamily)